LGAGPLAFRLPSESVLSDEFYQEIIAHPIPTDLEAVKVLAGAPAVLELFMWLTYRCFVAKGPEVIPILGAAGLVRIFSALVPLSGASNEGPFWIGPRPAASMAEIPRAVYYPIGPDYVKTMRIPLHRGRFLVKTDTRKSNRVVLIDTLMACRFFPGQDALGQKLTIPHWGANQNVSAEIVGIVGHVNQYALGGTVNEKPQIYFSFYQLPDEATRVFRSEISVVLRTADRATSVLPAVRQAVHDNGGAQPVYNVRTMPEFVSRSMGRQRFPMLLLMAFAVMALVLACVGIFGVISYSTARRVKEIGIRIALGAARSNIVGMVTGEGLRLAALGVAIGVAATLVLTKVVSRFSRLLYGVQAGDPVTLVTVSLMLIAAALLACYIPARRAATLDPTDSLRQD
jgi:putative ABC transport system permease protein